MKALPIFVQNGQYENIGGLYWHMYVNVCTYVYVYTLCKCMYHLYICMYVYVYVCLKIVKFRLLLQSVL